MPPAFILSQDQTLQKNLYFLSLFNFNLPVTQIDVLLSFQRTFLLISSCFLFQKYELYLNKVSNQSQYFFSKFFNFFLNFFLASLLYQHPFFLSAYWWYQIIGAMSTVFGKKIVFFEKSFKNNNKWRDLEDKFLFFDIFWIKMILDRMI